MSAKQSSGPPPVYRWLVIIGGAALMAAMAVDVLAVIGRATRMPLLGSIEIVQYVVGISGATGLIVATLNRRHAAVKILFNHLHGTSARIVGVINGLCAALFFLALFAGSVWVLGDLWSGYEESEFWRLSYRPLRIFVSLATLAVFALFLGQAWRGNRS